MSGFNFTYTPPPTIKRFMVSCKRLRAIRGPVGSGKSTGCAMELFRRACEAPKQADGIRRSKMVIVRNTLQQLKTTNLVTIQQLFGPIMYYKVSDQTIEIRVNDVHSDWLLLPLDTPENVQRLLSLELTAAWVSEFREIDPEIVQSVLSRCGRFPSRAVLTEEQAQLGYWYGVVMESNSFSEDSPWHDLLELAENCPPNWGYFIQPGAFDPGAENRENLPVNYYEDLMESNTPEWSEQYVHNRITPSLSGQAVFRKLFDPDFHIAESELIPIPTLPLIIGMDTGRNPSAVICQLDNIGRMLVFLALYIENMGMEQFLSTIVLPALQQERFRSCPAYIVLDPACRQRSQIGEESVLDCVRRLGFVAAPASTNAISPRLRAVERYLHEHRGGKAAMLFDRLGTSPLIIAMQSKYRYKIKKDKTLEEIPDKTHPWSDLADALQYACLGTQAGLRGRMMQLFNPKPFQASRLDQTSAGWT